MVRAMATQVEELPDNRVRLRVEVPQADLQHAVEHAASDLAQSVKVPGFRKGKVPSRVLEARVGRERIFSEAVESHIGGWFLNAAADPRIRPVAVPGYDYDLPHSEAAPFHFIPTASVQPKPEPADRTEREVPYPGPRARASSTRSTSCASTSSSGSATCSRRRPTPPSERTLWTCSRRPRACSPKGHSSRRGRASS